DRARDGDRSARDAGGRADRQSRYEDEPRDHAAARRPEPRARAHDRHGHARAADRRVRASRSAIRRRPDRVRPAPGERLMLLASVQLALRALARNLLRSALTMLGVVIGVAAVITIVTLGGGASERVSQGVASLGERLLFINP